MKLEVMWYSSKDLSAGQVIKSLIWLPRLVRSSLFYDYDGIGLSRIWIKCVRAEEMATEYIRLAYKIKGAVLLAAREKKEAVRPLLHYVPEAEDSKKAIEYILSSLLTHIDHVGEQIADSVRELKRTRSTVGNKNIGEIRKKLESLVLAPYKDWIG